jgi:triosephosphate isomerase
VSLLGHSEQRKVTKKKDDHIKKEVSTEILIELVSQVAEQRVK